MIHQGFIYRGCPRRRDFERRESVSDSYISSRISGRVTSGIILCFVGYIITLRATLSRERRSFRDGARETGARTGWMLRKLVDDFPESVIRRSAGTRASFVSIKRLREEAYPGKCVYVMWKWNGGGGSLSQTRSNNTTATIGRILMTLPALARDKRNGFIRFTYTPRDLNAFRPSRRYLAPYRGYKEHLLSFVIIIPTACSSAKYELFSYGEGED